MNHRFTKSRLSFSSFTNEDNFSDKFSLADQFKTPKKAKFIDDTCWSYNGDFSIPSGLKGHRVHSSLSETIISGITEDLGDTLLEYRGFYEEQSFSHPQDEERPQTIILMGWDDILLPSGFLQNAMISRSYAKTISTMAPLDESASRLLLTALGYGEVFIVTNSQKDWVEMSGQTFIPKTYQLIKDRKIEIIYAKTLYEEQFPQDPSKWKSEAFKSLHSRFETDIQTNLISISDSEAELLSVGGLSEKFDKCFMKTVKFASNPSIKELLNQHVFVVEGFSKIYNDEENLRVNIGVSPPKCTLAGRQQGGKYRFSK